MTPLPLHKCEIPPCQRNIEQSQPLCFQHSWTTGQHLSQRLRREYGLMLAGQPNCYAETLLECLAKIAVAK